MIKLHLLMTGSIPEAAYVDPAEAANAHDAKSREIGAAPSAVVTVPLVGNALLGEAIEDGVHKQSSPKMSKLASEIMRLEDMKSDSYNELLKNAKSLAASVLSQDETPGDGS